MSKFESRIKELRLENGLTYAQLASEFGKSEGAIRAWESGRTNPDIDTVIALAKKFNVSTDYLLGTSDARKPENEALISDFGLTDESINTIRTWSTLKGEPQNDIDEHDDRSLLNVFNQAAASEYFTHVLHCLKALTNPHFVNPSASQWEGDPFATVHAQKDGRAQAALYEKMLYGFIDDMVQELRTETARAKIGMIDIFSDKRKR